MSMDEMMPTSEAMEMAAVTLAQFQQFAESYEGCEAMEGMGRLLMEMMAQVKGGQQIVHTTFTPAQVKALQLSFNFISLTHLLGERARG